MSIKENGTPGVRQNTFLDGSISIGNPTDGDYTDGYVTITPSMQINDVIDDINELIRNEILPDPEIADRDIYVDIVGGDDIDGDGSVGKPFQTIDRAIEDISKFTETYRIDINLLDGIYTLSEGLNLYDKVGATGSRIRIESLNKNIVDSGNATSNNYYSMTDSSKSWTINEFAGCFLDCGCSTGLIPIAGNTSDTLYISNIGTDVVGAYSIRQMGATLQADTIYKRLVDNFPSEATVFAFQYLNIKNLEIIPQAGSNISFDFCQIYFNVNNNGISTKGLNQLFTNCSFVIDDAPIISAIELTGNTRCTFTALNMSAFTVMRATNSTNNTFYNAGSSRNLFFSIGDERYQNFNTYSHYGCVYIGWKSVFGDISGTQAICHTFPSFVGFGDFYKNLLIDCDFLAEVGYGQTVRNSAGFYGTPNIGWITEDGVNEIQDYLDISKYNVADFYTATLSSSFVKEWVPTREYSEGDSVLFNDFIYVAQTTNTDRQPNSYVNDWKIYERNRINADVNIYCDAISGSDITGDGSISSPYQTIDRAFNDVRSVLGHNDSITFHLRGSFSPNDFMIVLGTISNQDGLIEFKAWSGSETGALLDSGTFTTTSGLFKKIDTGKSWATNSFRGKILKDVSSGKLYRIGENTSTELYHNGDTSFGSITITNYEIYDYGASITANYISQHQLKGKIIFRDIECIGTTGIRQLFLQESAMRFINCNVNVPNIESLSVSFEISSVICSNTLVSSNKIQQVQFCALSIGGATTIVGNNFQNFVGYYNSGSKAPFPAFFISNDDPYAESQVQMIQALFKGWEYCFGFQSTFAPSASQGWVEKLYLGGNIDYENCDFLIYGAHNTCVFEADTAYFFTFNFNSSNLNVAPLTLDGSTEPTYYGDIERNINCLAISPPLKKLFKSTNLLSFNNTTSDLVSTNIESALIESENKRDFTNVITVGETYGDYQDLQDAIDASSTGTLILVYAGTYTGNYIINKTINMKAHSYDGQTCVLTSLSGTTFTFQTGTYTVTIEGFKLLAPTSSNSDKLIDWGGGNVTFRNCFSTLTTSNTYQTVILSNGSLGQQFTLSNTFFSYNLTGLTSGTNSHKIVDHIGAGTFNYALTNLIVVNSGTDTLDDFCGIYIDPGATGPVLGLLNFFYIDNKVSSYTGKMTAICAENTANSKSTKYTEVQMVSVDGGDGAFLRSELGNSTEFDSAFNTVDVIGFDKNYYAYMAAGSTANLHYDKVNAYDFTAGGGVINLANKFTQNVSTTLTGSVTAPKALNGAYKTLYTSQTGNIATFSGDGQHVMVNINSYTPGATLTFTGISVGEADGIPITGDTEVITPTSTGTYQTLKKWQEVSITITGTVNYDVILLGYDDISNSNFRLASYRLDIVSEGLNSAIRYKIYGVKTDGTQKTTITVLEDISITNAGLTDNLRTGAEDRSFTSSVTYWATGTTINKKQVDFNEYFSGQENLFRGSTNADGFIVEIVSFNKVGLFNLNVILETL